jgi:two-component system sensor histidine kinase CpxA
MKPFSSLFSKILLCFFLNLALVAAVLVAFFAFQSQIDLYAIFGRQASDRLRTAGRLISHELNQVPIENWSDVLARHAEIHQVDFALLFKGGFQSLSKDMDIPEAVMKMVMGPFRPKPPKNEVSLPPKPRDKHGRKHRFMMRTKNPTRYGCT